MPAVAGEVDRSGADQTQQPRQRVVPALSRQVGERTRHPQSAEGPLHERRVLEVSEDEGMTRQEDACLRQRTERQVDPDGVESSVAQHPQVVRRTAADVEHQVVAARIGREAADVGDRPTQAHLVAVLPGDRPVRVDRASGPRVHLRAHRCTSTWS